MLEIDGLRISYRGTEVLHGIDLRIEPGERIGLIGESGSGKTTIGRALLGLVRPTAGTVSFEGTSLTDLDRARKRRFRAAVQPVFQEGAETLNPRRLVGASLADGLTAARRFGTAQTRTVDELLRLVELDPQFAERRPSELSGGQRQRVSIARALAVGPSVLVLDEPTSALDPTTQAHIVDLIEALATDEQLGYVLISHNLAIIDRLCDTVHVLRQGEIVESGSRSQIIDDPQHEYTRRLRDSVAELLLD
ncbi:ATP-binding cassette domain-containing protein [Plantibacter flavus]|uniref:ABC transporter ATP-binding protein n=1 Tax=Plantibacter flavus TaxID=150123 RepID=UPI003F18E868